jgi:hypothetical protein
MKPRFTVEHWPANADHIEYFAIRDTRTRIVIALRTDLATATTDADRMNTETSSTIEDQS